jgi:hypothetical protein
MNKSVPEISYERNLNHNYMILKSYDFLGELHENQSDFRKRMILENNIEGLLPIRQRNNNGEVCYSYEINSMQSIDRLYAKKEIGCEELKHILMACVRLFERLEEYLLDGSQVILKPEFIYMNIDTNRFYFVCYPEYEGDVREEFGEFVDMLLTKIDHTDNNAVMLGYKVYRCTKNPNFVIGEIAHIIEATMPKCEEVIIPQWQGEFGFCGNEIGNANNDEMYNHTAKKDKKTTKIRGEKSGISFGKAREKKSDCLSGGKVDGKVDGKVNGRVICLVIAAVSIGIIAAAKVTGLEGVIADVELYLYGIIAMSLVGVGIFAVRDSKKKKLEKEKKALGVPCEDGFGAFVPNNVVPSNIVSSNIISGNIVPNNIAHKNIVSSNIASNNVAQNNIVHGNIAPNNIVPNNIVANNVAHKNIVPNNIVSNNIASNIIYKQSGKVNEKPQGTTCLKSTSLEERVLIGRVNGKEVTIPLTNFPTTLGKQPGISDIILDDNAVSKMHAKFEEHEGRIYISDLNSTNGTIRNGAMLDINSPVVLEVGDRLRFGRSCFTYC